MDKILFWRHKDEDFKRPLEMGLGKERDQGLGLEDETVEPRMHSPATPPSFQQDMGPDPQSAFSQHDQHYQPTQYQPSQQPTFQHQPSQPSISISHRDIEVISAKLDTLKATLDNLNHRLENIERMAREGI